MVSLWFRDGVGGGSRAGKDLDQSSREDGRGRTGSLEKKDGKTDAVLKKTQTGKMYRFPVAELSAKDRKHAAAFAKRTATSRNTKPGSLQDILGSRLVRLTKDGKLKPFKLTREVDCYAVCYSASRRGPCRQFTPKLVEFYSRNRKRRDRFEIIFVSSSSRRRHAGPDDLIGVALVSLNSTVLTGCQSPFL